MSAPIEYVELVRISTDWEIIPKTNINEPKAIALVDNAVIDIKKTDNTIRTIQFRRGSVIKYSFQNGKAMQTWQPSDVIFDSEG